MSVTTNGRPITGRPITRGDLETAFRRVVGEGEKTVESAVPAAFVIAGAIGLALATIAYLAGKRRGGHKSSVIEIRRL